MLIGMTEWSSYPFNLIQWRSTNNGIASLCCVSKLPSLFKNSTSKSCLEQIMIRFCKSLGAPRWNSFKRPSVEDVIVSTAMVMIISIFSCSREENKYLIEKYLKILQEYTNDNSSQQRLCRFVSIVILVLRFVWSMWIAMIVEYVYDVLSFVSCVIAVEFGRSRSNSSNSSYTIENLKYLIGSLSFRQPPSK